MVWARSPHHLARSGPGGAATGLDQTLTDEGTLMPLTSDPQTSTVPRREQPLRTRDSALLSWPEGRTPGFVQRWAEALVQAAPGSTPDSPGLNSSALNRPALVAHLRETLDLALDGKQVAVFGDLADASCAARPWAVAGVAQARHPLTGSRVTSLTWLAANRPGALTSLLGTLRADGLLEQAALESEAGGGFRQQELTAGGFHPVAWTMRRSNPTPAGDHPPQAAPGVDVHPMRDDEEEFVHQCVVTALRRGLGGDDCAIDLDAWARRRLPLREGDPTCVVATVDGVPVAHGLAYPRTDPIATGRLAYVADVFVIPGQHGHGYSHAVSQALLHALALKGFDEVESDVAAGPGSEQLRRNLTDAGWQEWRIRWQTP